MTETATTTITGVLLDAQNATAKRATIADTLDSYYTHLNCDIIDIVSRTIGGKRFDIICDDEGTFREDVRISALDCNYSPALVGSLFVCKSHRGELVSLTDAEVKHILNHTRKIPTREHPEGLAMFVDVGY